MMNVFTASIGYVACVHFIALVTLVGYVMPRTLPSEVDKTKVSCKDDIVTNSDASDVEVIHTELKELKELQSHPVKPLDLKKAD